MLNPINPKNLDKRLQADGYVRKTLAVSLMLLMAQAAHAAEPTKVAADNKAVDATLEAYQDIAARAQHTASQPGNADTRPADASNLSASTALSAPTILTPSEIDARLQAARQSAPRGSRQIAGLIRDITDGDSAINNSNSNSQPSATPIQNISRIGSTDAPIGILPAQASSVSTEAPSENTTSSAQNVAGQAPNHSQIYHHFDNQNHAETVRSIAEGEVDPASYLPLLDAVPDDGQTLLVSEYDPPKEPSLIRRTYDRLFNDGVSPVPRLKVHLYQARTPTTSDGIAAGHHVVTDGGLVSGEKELQAGVAIAADEVSRSQAKREPYANIRAALEDVTQESVANFTESMPRLRQTALAAARAVGYYDIELSIAKRATGEIDVLIEKLGEPVRVSNRALEVRGEGSADTAYQAVVKSATLQPGDVFHHGQYEASKMAIEDISGEKGFLDGRWLNSAVDVVLPDNLADVSLIYDSGPQYAFDEVVFFTYDPETKQMTTDPNKLPVKPELLRKLVTFQMGDAYNRQAVRELSNDLLATGYFNMLNTETVHPERSSSTGVSFTEGGSATPPVNETVDLGDGITAEFAPLEFSTSEVVKDKLDQVAAKAQTLYNLPDDRVLPSGSDFESRSILARISDAVSSVAKAILPDESRDDVLDPALTGRPELDNKKSAQAVYDDKKIPLYIFVMSDKPKDAQIGLGWGTDTGARMVGKFEHNLIDRHGTQAGAELRLSQKQQGVRLYANRPLSHPLNDKLQASLSYNEETLDQPFNGYDISSRTLEQGISRNIVSKNGWNRSYSLRYRLDELESNAPRDVIDDLPVKFLDGKPTQEALLAGVAVHKTVADNLINPMRGYRQQYSLEVGSGSLFTDTDMAIARAGVSGVYSFGDNAYGKDRAHQVVGSLQTGYIWAKNFEDVPYKLRFFAGGDQSIRGYNYNSLSPMSSAEYLTGGQALAVGSFEYNYEVMKDLRLATFVDVGNAYDKNFSNDTKIGAGVGVRWASPVGQLRVDVATGVKEEGTPIKLHFFIGTPF